MTTENPSADRPAADTNLDQRLLDVALTGYQSGMVTALANLGLPLTHVVHFAHHAVARIREDPIARTAVIDDARLIWEGRESERKPIALRTPCDHPHHQHGGDS